ncbi:MAG: hypothetical protein R3F01_03450 [Lysobacteraceae bacterium]
MDRDNQALASHCWARSTEPVPSAFTEPFDTWAPMTQLLCREDWPALTIRKSVLLLQRLPDGGLSAV